MNEDLRDRLDDFASDASDERLDWAALGGAIRAGVAARERKRRRRVAWWWWLGGLGVIVAALLFFAGGEGPYRSTDGEFGTGDAEAVGRRMPSALENSPPTTAPPAAPQPIARQPTPAQLLSTDASATGPEPNSATYTDLATPRDAVTAAEAAVLSAATERPESGAAMTAPLVHVASAVPEAPAVSDVLASGASPVAARDGHAIPEAFGPLLAEPIGSVTLAPLPIGSPSIGPLPAVAPPVKPVTPASPWSVELAGGGLRSGAAASYGQTDDLTGAVSSVRVEYALAPRFYVSAGLQQSLYRFLAARTSVDTVRESRPGQVARVFLYGAGETYAEFVDSIDVERTRVLRQYSRQTSLSIPVAVGARWGRGRLWYGAQAGGVLGLRQDLSGRLVGLDGELRLVEDTQTRLSVRPLLGVEAGVRLWGRWGVRGLVSGYWAEGVQAGGFGVGQAELGLRWGG